MFIFDKYKTLTPTVFLLEYRLLYNITDEVGQVFVLIDILLKGFLNKRQKKKLISCVK